MKKSSGFFYEIFILYVNDLFNEIDNEEGILMYADDTLYINNGKNVQESTLCSQQMLDKVVTWCKTNKMTVNIDKTKCMLINPLSTKDVSSWKIMIDDKALSRVHVYEYLGVQIDDKLNMSNQIDNICKKVQQKHGILKKIRKYIGMRTALSIYKTCTMIRPHFDYVDFIIDSGIQSKIQDKIIRTIEYRWKREDCEDIENLKESYRVETLSDRRKCSLLKIMYKQSHIDNNIDTYRPDRILRSSKKVKMKTPFTRITKIQKSPYYRGIYLWNELPQDLQNEKDIERFRSAINIYKLVN